MRRNGPESARGFRFGDVCAHWPLTGPSYAHGGQSMWGGKRVTSVWKDRGCVSCGRVVVEVMLRSAWCCHPKSRAGTKWLRQMGDGRRRMKKMMKREDGMVRRAGSVHALGATHPPITASGARFVRLVSSVAQKPARSGCPSFHPLSRERAISA